jgi:hypothetical protein
MHTLSTVTDQPATPFHGLRSSEAISIGLASFAGFLLFTYFLGGGRGTIAGAFLCAFGLTLRTCWPLHKKRWFWVAILVLAALHIVAVAAFRWSAAAQWTGLTFMPFTAADTALLLTVIFFIYRSIYGPPARLFTWPEPRYAEDVE